MTDDGDGGHRLTLNGGNYNNVVLKSSFAACTRGFLRYSHLNPESAAAHIDDIAELFKGINMHIIWVSETWFKKWHTNKRIGINGYKVIRADRSDGRRGCGVALYIEDGLKYKVLAKSEKPSVIDYLFIELKFFGENILVGLIYNPPGVFGLPVYRNILEDLYPRYQRRSLMLHLTDSMT
jgi:hypothetical protein